MNKANDYYIKQMNSVLSEFDNPKILIHSCCAPCSSYCLLTLREVAKVTAFFYNPNISDRDEYQKRYEELERLVGIYNNNKSIKLKDDCRQVNITKSYVNDIEVINSDFENDLFLEKCRGYEDCPERGARCSICFDLRLRKTAIYAKENGFDLFATTLTLSPLKNADLLNEIGEKISKEIGIKYLPTDFKKKNGYKTSIELSKEYDLYRQNFCGCDFSKRQVKE